jgi:hypothetical protein
VPDPTGADDRRDEVLEAPLSARGQTARRPAFYAVRAGRWGDWWTLLHPPYTAWHLSYVVVGACLAPQVSASRLLATLLAFFFAVGLAAHALDELHGRPLGTRIPSPVLATVTVAGLAGAVTLGALGLSRVGVALVPFMVLGPLLVLGYNLELLGGALHHDWGFALAWGSFPVLVAYVAQAGDLAWPPVLAAGAAFALSFAQRQLSTPARRIRRRSVEVQGRVVLRDGQVLPVSAASLLEPLERALVAMSWGLVALAGSLALARLG